jgi:hypothetical protein
VSRTLPLPKQRKGSANTSVLLPSRGLAGRAGSFLRDSAPLTWGTPYDILSPDSRTSVGPSCVGWDTARVGPGPRGCKERKERLHSGEPSAPYCPGIPRAGGGVAEATPPPYGWKMRLLDQVYWSSSGLCVPHCLSQDLSAVQASEDKTRSRTSRNLYRLCCTWQEGKTHTARSARTAVLVNN